MLTKHLFKTIVGFCGMILIGLISLVLIDNYQGKEEEAQIPVVYAGTEDISSGSVNTPKNTSETNTPEVKLLPYHEALGLYMGRRIEITDECKVIPNTMTFKNNTKVMIDNHSSKLKTIKIGKSMTIKEQGFKIINLSSSKLPVKLAMGCDAQNSAATITLEK